MKLLVGKGEEIIIGPRKGKGVKKMNKKTRTILFISVAGKKNKTHFCYEGEINGLKEILGFFT